MFRSRKQCILTVQTFLGINWSKFQRCLLLFLAFLDWAADAASISGTGRTWNRATNHSWHIKKTLQGSWFNEACDQHMKLGICFRPLCNKGGGNAAWDACSLMSLLVCYIRRHSHVLPCLSLSLFCSSSWNLMFAGYLSVSRLRFVLCSLSSVLLLVAFVWPEAGPLD